VTVFSTRLIFHAVHFQLIILYTTSVIYRRSFANERHLSPKTQKYFVKQPTLHEWQEKISRIPTHIRVTYQEQVRISDLENPVITYPYTFTTANFEGHIQGPTRGAK
jgi:hypothetical protein